MRSQALIFFRATLCTLFVFVEVSRVVKKREDINLKTEIIDDNVLLNSPKAYFFFQVNLLLAVSVPPIQAFVARSYKYVPKAHEMLAKGQNCTLKKKGKAR